MRADTEGFCAPGAVGEKDQMGSQVRGPRGGAFASTAQANRIAVSEGLFRCADVLRAQGQRKEAQAIYEQLRTAGVPEYVRAGATKAEAAIQPRGR